MIGQATYTRKRIYERYKIIGFISSGTYGRVYKAQGKTGQIGEFAIKKCVLPSLKFLPADRVIQIQTGQRRRSRIHRHLTVCYPGDGTMH
jgi:hypothetical protein